MDGNDLDTSQVDVPGSLWTQINLYEASQMKKHHLGSSMLRLVGLHGDPTQDTPNEIGLGCLKMKNKGRSVPSSTIEPLQQWDSDAQLRLNILKFYTHATLAIKSTTSP